MRLHMNAFFLFMIVEASLSEPHTSETACARVCVCLFVWTDHVFQILFMQKKKKNWMQYSQQL